MGILHAGSHGQQSRDGVSLLRVNVLCVSMLIKSSIGRRDAATMGGGRSRSRVSKWNDTSRVLDSTWFGVGVGVRRGPARLRSHFHESVGGGFNP